MNTRFKKFILVAASMSVISHLAYGEGAGNSETAATSLPSSSAPDIKNSASTASSQNKKGDTLAKGVGVLNIGLGGMYMAKFAASCSPTCNGWFAAQGALHFLMGAQSFKQASNHGGSGYQSDQTVSDTSWKDPFANNSGKSPTPGDALGGDIDSDANLKGKIDSGKFAKIKSDLFTNGLGGYKMDPKTGILTNTKTGQKYDPDKLTTPQSLADAGFSNQDINNAYGTSKKAEDALKKQLGIESIGAATKENGYENGSSSSATLAADAGAAVSYGGRGVASIRAPSTQIAGLSKNFNGERIGVAAENIFNMMARCYKKKEKQDAFLDPSALIKSSQ